VVVQLDKDPSLGQTEVAGVFSRIVLSSINPITIGLQPTALVRSIFSDTKSFAFTHVSSGSINQQLEPSFDKLLNT
jgi:hypothetical protein